MVAWFHAIALQVDPPRPFYQGVLRFMGVLNGGVDIFFVLSGFIISHSATRYIGRREGLHFLKNRFIRLNPVYYIAVLLFFIVRWHWLKSNHLLPGSASILKSVLLFPVADGRTWSEYILPVAWTLCFEWFFYLLFAGAVALRIRNKALPLTVLILLLVGTQHFLAFRDFRIRFIATPMLLDFIFGMLISRGYTFYRPPPPPFPS